LAPTEIFKNLKGTTSESLAIINFKEKVQQFWKKISSKESLFRQKSRTKWVQEGDSNSRFFHASIKGRRRRNQIVLLKKGEELIERGGSN
jgi:hypothetical protein